MHTQASVAKALGVSPTLFNYWYNHAKTIRIEIVVAMKALLKAKTEGLPFNLPRRLQESVIEEIIFNYEPFETANQKQPKAISKSVKLAMKFELELNLPKGRPSSKRKESDSFRDLEICPNLDKFSRRSSEIAAKKFGFSRGTYLNAKKVALKGAPKLIQSMDERKISIYQASLIADFPLSDQLKLLLMDSKERMAFLRKNKEIQESFNKESSKKQLLYLVIFSDAEHKQVKESYQIAESINSDLIIKSLTICCGDDPYFEWKTLIEASSMIDSQSFLKVLCELSLKEKLKESADA